MLHQTWWNRFNFGNPAPQFGVRFFGTSNTGTGGLMQVAGSTYSGATNYTMAVLFRLNQWLASFCNGQWGTVNSYIAAPSNDIIYPGAAPIGFRLWWQNGPDVRFGEFDADSAGLQVGDNIALVYAYNGPAATEALRARMFVGAWRAGVNVLPFTPQPLTFGNAFGVTTVPNAFEPTVDPIQIGGANTYGTAQDMDAIIARVAMINTTLSDPIIDTLFDTSGNPGDWGPVFGAGDLFLMGNAPGDGPITINNLGAGGNGTLQNGGAPGSQPIIVPW